MSPTTDADTRSPWYETFTPAMWVVAAEAEEPPAPSSTDSEKADEEWATEAIFDYYND